MSARKAGATLLVSLSVPSKFPPNCCSIIGRSRHLLFRPSSVADISRQISLLWIYRDALLLSSRHPKVARHCIWQKLDSEDRLRCSIVREEVSRAFVVVEIVKPDVVCNMRRICVVSHVAWPYPLYFLRINLSFSSVSFCGIKIAARLAFRRGHSLLRRPSQPLWPKSTWEKANCSENKRSQNNTYD